jgi:hypothetical protein
MWHEYLDEVLSDFSGYVAADELYDGPFCVLSIVDNRNFRRLVYEVLDRNPTKGDVERLFGRFKAELDSRGLTLCGITTDGSPLYPEPIANVFGPVRHQVCEFHVIKELVKAILHAVAKVRKAVAAEIPNLPRGRPTGKTRHDARKAKRLRRKVRDLFEGRHLFVKRRLTEAEKKTLTSITRGQPELRALRRIMDEVYRLFDPERPGVSGRRCRTETALAKLGKLRARVRRFKKVGKTLSKLFSPNLEKALTFLDDRLLPSTSNAVERGNRRHRKMQKSIYRVRTKPHVSGRIAQDMLREARAQTRADTTQVLHLQRAA